MRLEIPQPSPTPPAQARGPPSSGEAARPVVRPLDRFLAKPPVTFRRLCPKAVELALGADEPPARSRPAPQKITRLRT